MQKEGKQLIGSRSFIAIGKGAFVPSNFVKLLIDAEAKAADKLTSDAREAGLIRSTVTKGQKRVSIVVMKDNLTYLISYRADTIAERLEEKGVCTIKVAPGIYVPADNINGIYEYGSTLATKLRTGQNAAPNVSLVRKTTKRRSSLLLDTGEILNISPTPDLVVRKLEKVGNVDNFSGDQEIHGGFGKK